MKTQTNKRYLQDGRTAFEVCKPQKSRLNTVAAVFLAFTVLFLISKSYSAHKYTLPPILRLNEVQIIDTVEAHGTSNEHFTPNDNLNVLQGKYEAAVGVLAKATVDLAYAKLKAATELSNAKEISRLRSLLLSLGEDIESTPSNLDALAYAVAMHETHGCEDDTNYTAVNNCFGIRKYRDGRLQPARYATREDSYEDFKDIWTRLYAANANPTMDNADKWSGGDRADDWYNNVHFYIKKYNKT